jgi:Ca-activated chloride channel family protein
MFVCLALLLTCFQFGVDLWLTPDQQGRRHFDRGEFLEAAALFRDPMWQGAALYRAGEFEKAAQAFTRRDTDVGLYNQGNAWLMHGEYEKAIGCYDRALERRPDWKDAIDNRELATARAAMVKQTGGDLGDQKIGADKIVFDKKAKNEGQDTEVDGGAAISDKEIQAMWLRRVQTRPADFLKAKFAYQQAMKQGAAE